VRAAQPQQLRLRALELAAGGVPLVLHALEVKAELRQLGGGVGEVRLAGRVQIQVSAHVVVLRTQLLHFHLHTPEHTQ
jgi:hypothetical protein